MKLKFTAFFFNLLIFCLLNMCGLPNPFELSRNVNLPFNVETSSDGNTITMVIESNNDEETSPLFRGYNILWGETVNEGEVNTRLIYVTPDSFPTVKENPGASGSSLSTTISFDGAFNYINLSTSNDTSGDTRIGSEGNKFRREIETYDTYYFVITAFAQGDSIGIPTLGEYAVVYSESIEKNESISSFPSGNVLTILGKEFASVSIATITTTNIVPSADTQLQQIGPSTVWEEVNEAPEAGYTYSTWPIKVGNIYIFSYDSGKAYGKLQIQGIDSTTIDFRYSYQENGNEI